MSNLKFLEKNGVFSKIDSGKTTLEERIRKVIERTHKIGEVRDDKTITDFVVQEDTSRLAEWAKPRKN